MTSLSSSPILSPLDWSRAPTTVEDIIWHPDPRWFFEILCKIPTQTHGIAPFDLWPWMHNAVSAGLTDDMLILKSRDVGSSTFWIAEKVKKVLMHEGRNLIIASEQQKSAVALLEYAKAIIKNLPESCQPHIGNDNTEEIVFDKLGSKIIALPGTPDSGRGLRCYYLICTEMAFWKEPKKYFAAVTGTMVPGGERVIESTANGEGTMHHVMWTQAKEGSIASKPLFVGVWENPNHTPEWYSLKRAEYLREDKPDHLFFQEYPQTEDESISASAYNYFSKELLAVGRTYESMPIEVREIGDQDHKLGTIRIWRHPTPGSFYVAGVDAAEGKGSSDDPDWSHAAIHEWRTGAIVCAIHSRQHDKDFVETLFEWLLRYNKAFVAVERNGIGMAVLRGLENLGHKNIYYHVKQTGLAQSPTAQPQIGWHTTAATKPTLLMNLSIDLKAMNLLVQDWMFWDQAATFDRLALRSRVGHDDVVMSTAIANEARRVFTPDMIKDPVEDAINRAVRQTKGSWANLFTPAPK